jgi:hypothetical protein
MHIMPVRGTSSPDVVMSDAASVKNLQRMKRGFLYILWEDIDVGECG